MVVEFSGLQCSLIGELAEHAGTLAGQQMGKTEVSVRTSLETVP